MLSQKEIVELDDERKAAMVSNLLVVLCGERGAQPILNPGTIYQQADVRSEGVSPPDRPQSAREALQRWADEDLRSLNAQIEFVLRRTLQEAGRLKEKKST